MDIFEIVKTLSPMFGPSGQEGPIREKIAEMARPFADSVETDVLGNLIVRKRGAGKKVMLCAHMDTIGLVVTHVGQDGYLSLSNLGGINLTRTLGSLVEFQNGTRGIVGIDGKADPKDLKMENFFIDIGAPDADSARKKVAPGDAAVFCQPCVMMGDNIASPYLDDRVACAVMLAALERVKEPKNDLYFVFSVQEEVGCRGAKTAAFAIEPDYGFSVDVTGVGDIPETKPPMDVKLGGGAAIKIMDQSLICHPRVVDYLRRGAQAKGIPYQTEILLRGGTDASAVQVSRGGAYSGGISIPTRYVHNPLEMCRLSDVLACVELALEACEIDLENAPTD